MPSVPERFSWAMSFLPVKPHHQVLEIGCGNGLLAQLIIAVLNNGFILGIDQSAHAIPPARKRNQEAMQQQKAKFECCSIHDRKPTQSSMYKPNRIYQLKRCTFKS